MNRARINRSAGNDATRFGNKSAVSVLRQAILVFAIAALILGNSYVSFSGSPYLAGHTPAKSAAQATQSAQTGGSSGASQKGPSSLSTHYRHVDVPVATIVTTAYSISVSTNSSSYSGSQIVGVSGLVSPSPGPGTAVFIQVNNPNDTVVHVDSIPVDGSTGSFSDNFTAGGTNWIAGTYNLTATWAYCLSCTVYSANTTFTYTPSTSQNFKVTFLEKGLPSLTPWSVNLNGRLESSNTSSIIFYEPNGTYPFSVYSNGYVANVTFGNVVVSGANVTEKIGFVQAKYNVSFVEAGLPKGATWNVNLNGTIRSSSTSLIAFSEPNGAYTYSVYSSGFVANVSSGTVGVSGANYTVHVGFTPAKYSVSFVESGLPSGTKWNVKLNGTLLTSSTNKIVFSVPNGTYPFSVSSKGYVANVSSGTVAVAGKNATVPISFTPAKYTISFVETGLPSGTTWGVSFNGTAKNSTTNTVVLRAPNGTYSFVVGNLSGYIPSPTKGSVTVKGQNQTLQVTFTQVFTVTFNATGLQQGATWSVNLNGVNKSTTGSSITFRRAQGYYYYSVSAVGYGPNPSGGWVYVNNANVNQTISFAKLYAVTFNETGLAKGTLWNVWSYNGYEASNTSQIITYAPSDTYVYFSVAANGYSASPSSGYVYVNGANVTENIVFTPLSKVTLVETGLPPGTYWYVYLYGSYNYSNTNTITFYAPNGTYYFYVGSYSNGYSPSQSSGVVVVSGASEVNVTFVTLHTISFVQSGLAPGTCWYVTLNGSSEYSCYYSTVQFFEPNGNYTYSVHTYSEFQAKVSPSSGSIQLNNADVNVNLTFASSNFQVKLVDQHGNPASGLQVSLTLNGTYIINEQTNESGWTQPLQIAQGTSVSVSVSTTNTIYESITPASYTVGAGNNLETITLQTFGAIGYLRGTVTYSGGSPVSGATVTATEAGQGGPVTISNSTDSNGHYELTLLSGLAVVSVSSSDNAFLSSAQNATITANTVSTLNFTVVQVRQGNVLIQLYTQYVGGQLVGPLQIDWRVSVHFGLSVTGPDGSQYGFPYSSSSNNTVQVKGVPGEQFRVCVNGYQADLPSECVYATMDSSMNATAVLILQQQGVVRGNVIDGTTGKSVSSWSASVYLVNSSGFATFVENEQNSSSSLSFSVPQAGLYEIYITSGDLTSTVPANVTQAQISPIGNVSLLPVGYFGGKSGNTFVSTPSIATIGSSVLLRGTYNYTGSKEIYNASLLLGVPLGTTLQNGSITLNGVQVTNAVLNGSYYIIELGNLSAGASGVVSYTLQITSTIGNATVLRPLLLIDYTLTGSHVQEVAGGAQIQITHVTITAPTEVSSLSTQVSGQASPGSTVTVFDGNVSIGRVSVTGGGFWSLKVTLVNSTNPTHTLYAVSNSTSGVVQRSNSIQVLYDTSLSALVQVCMQQTDGRRLCFNPQQGVAQFPYVVVPGMPISFDLNFTSPQYIFNVTVTIQNAGTASATLGSDNLFHASITPSGYSGLGAIYVGYTQELFALGNGSIQGGLTPKQMFDVLPSVWHSANATLVSSNSTGFDATIQFPNGTSSIPNGTELEASESLSIASDVVYTPTASDIQFVNETGYPFFNYTLTIANTTGGVVVHFSFFVPYSALNSTIVSEFDDATKAVSDYGPAVTGLVITGTQVLKVAGKATPGLGAVLNGISLYQDLAWLYHENQELNQWQSILSQICDSNYAASAQSQISTLRIQVNTVGSSATTLDIIGGVTSFGELLGPAFVVSAPVAIGSAILGLGTPAAENSLGDQIDQGYHDAQSKAMQSNNCQPNPPPTATPTWVYDPSGFVYEAVTSNRLANVTATIYELVNGSWVLWDAAPFGQNSTEITNALGQYGWDVPQGFWKVVYQLPGYQTAQSMILDVPPPATGVNIGLISLQSPQVSAVSAVSFNGSSYVDVQFSKYVKTSTANLIFVTVPGGANISGTIKPIDVQQSPGGTNLTTEIQFVPNEQLRPGTTYTVHVGHGIQSYANVTMAANYAVNVTTIGSLSYDAGTSAVNGLVSPGNSLTANANTTDPLATHVKFEWVNPQNSIEQIQTVSTNFNATSGVGLAQSASFTPDSKGVWTLKAIFGSGTNVYKTVATNFTVATPVSSNTKTNIPVVNTSIALVTLNNTGSFNANTSNVNGIDVSGSGTNSSLGPTVTVNSFIYSSTPPGVTNLAGQTGGSVLIYIDVKVTNVSGTANVCVTNSSITSTSQMYYFPPGATSWVAATNVVFKAPDTLCGKIPISALGGTPIAVIQPQTSVPPPPPSSTSTSTVTFTETGLPSGTSWSVTFNGNTTSSTTDSIMFSNVADGSYSWSVSSPISGGSDIRFAASSGASGTMTVPTQTSQSVQFTTQYQVSIVSGTGGTTSPSGTSWYDSNSALTITATASNGFAFSSWSTSNPSLSIQNPSAPSTTVTVGGPGIVTASFVATSTTSSTTTSSSVSTTSTSSTTTTTSSTQRTTTSSSTSTSTTQTSHTSSTSSTTPPPPPPFLPSTYLVGIAILVIALLAAATFLIRRRRA